MRRSVKIFLFLVVIVAVAGAFSLSRHYIPEVRGFFVSAGLDAPITEFEQAVLDAVSGNPMAMLSAVGAAVTAGGTAIKLLTDKTGSLVSQVTELRKDKSALLLNLTGEKERITEELTTQYDSLKGLYDDTKAELDATKTQATTQINSLNVDLIATKQQLTDVQAELTKALTENGTLTTRVAQLSKTSYG